MDANVIQLGLFPGYEQVIDNSGQPKRKSRKRYQPVIVENSCTTARAAKLLNISTTTLYRAKNEGKSYRCGRWTAICIGPNCWKVTHDRT
jgi:DNA invertase Pin-like site-specific DNA recombinase